MRALAHVMALPLLKHVAAPSNRWTRGRLGRRDIGCAELFYSSDTRLPSHRSGHTVAHGRSVRGQAILGPPSVVAANSTLGDPKPRTLNPLTGGRPQASVLSLVHLSRRRRRPLHVAEPCHPLRRTP